MQEAITEPKIMSTATVTHGQSENITVGSDPGEIKVVEKRVEPVWPQE